LAISDNQEIIEIDGSIGGGSVLRVGVPLAIGLNKPIHVKNVRQHRKKKGLRTQHLTGLRLLSQLTGSVFDGASIGSSSITIYPNQLFVPHNPQPMIQLPTSAAVSLIIQTLSNYVFVSRKPIGFDFVGGGTHVNWSPNFDILMQVNKPLFEMFGLKLHIQLMKPGFYPNGGAMGRIYMEPSSQNQVILEECGHLEKTEVISNASSDLKSQKVAELQVAGYRSVFSDVDNVMAGYAEANSSGSSCSAYAKYDTGAIKGVARIWQNGIDPRDVGRRTGMALKREMESHAAMDEQMADQLILPLALSQSGSRYSFQRMYPHVETNFKVVRHILGDVLEISKSEDLYLLQKL
jgi:RNA 3'-terminal phosphate cyclase (ATP)